MNPTKACEIVIKESGNVKINSIVDIGAAYVVGICGVNGEEIGEPPISVDKRTGETDVFFLPDTTNFKLLDSGANIEVPAQYKPRQN